MTLCEEAVFQSLASLQLSSVPLERLLESLPGQRVDHKSLEKLKKSCSPQQQVLQLLRLWKEQNKDQDKLYGIIQGIDNVHMNALAKVWLLFHFLLCILILELHMSRCEPL